MYTVLGMFLVLFCFSWGGGCSGVYTIGVAVDASCRCRTCEPISQQRATQPTNQSTIMINKSNAVV